MDPQTRFFHLHPEQGFLDKSQRPRAEFLIEITDDLENRAMNSHTSAD